MFLKYLQDENKEPFLKLCVYAAMANDVFEEEEKEMLGAYCREMNLTEHIPETNGSLENALAEIYKTTTEVERKIMTLEILGLVKSDGVYDEKESAFMKKVIKGLEIKEEVLSKIDSLLTVYTAVCKELFAAMTE